MGFKGVKKNFDWCLREVSKVLQGCFKKVLRVFQKCVDEVYYANLLVHGSHRSYPSRSRAYVMAKVS